MKRADADSPDEAGAREATPETVKALQWLKHSAAQEELLGEISQQVGRRRRRRIEAVATACLVLVLCAVVWRKGLVTAATGERPLAALQPTATISAPAREVLPDGSVVELKEGAAIAHDYTEARRSVTLLRGEAHFQVARNPVRPFVVTAGGVAVRAVGTAFSVQFGAAAVEVLVTEGRVAIEKSGATATAPAAVEPPALLQARDHALIRHAEVEFVPELSTVPETDLAKRLAWRVPQLEFSRTPLPEVITLMNRHGGDGRIVADLPATELADMKLSGFLAADNVDGLVRMLEANFPLVAERHAGGIRLRKRTP